MADEDDAIAAAAVDLNADAKAKRKAKPGQLTGQDGEVLLDAGEAEQQGGGFDAEGQHQTAVDRMFNMVDELELDPSAMVYDVRDFLIDTIKARPKPWSATSQAEQRDVAAACEHAATELIRRIVEQVAARGVDSIRVLLTKVNAAGDDIVITGKVKFLDADGPERDKSVLSLYHAIGKHVMLTRASVEDYRQDGREAATDADEPDLGFGFEGDQDHDGELDEG